MDGSRSDLYALLAETLSGAPAWFRLPATEWPLCVTAVRLATHSPAAARASERLAQIPGESWERRKARYHDLFDGASQPRYWLYESMNKEGSLAGASTAAVARIYRAAGLEVVGAELPDHASVELSFLSYLAGRQDVGMAEAVIWRRLERYFIRRYAGCWLPQLGRALAASADAVYGPIGALLSDWLREAVRPTRVSDPSAGRHLLLAMNQPESCTLCGFCAQVCPTRALAVVESECETTLQLWPSRCTACRRCVDICARGAGALEVVTAVVENMVGDEPSVLRRSARAACSSCGQPTVSQAELDYVTARLGDLEWLAYCEACRQRPQRSRDELSHRVPNLPFSFLAD